MENIWASVDWSSGLDSVGKVFIIPSDLEDHDDNHNVENTKSDKAETEYLTTSEGNNETSVNTSSAHVSNSGVGVDGNSHSNVSSKDGSAGSSEEGDGSVWEVSWSNLSSHLKDIYGTSEENSEENSPDHEDNVFFSKESFSTLFKKHN